MTANAQEARQERFPGQEGAREVVEGAGWDLGGHLVQQLHLHTQK